MVQNIFGSAIHHQSTADSALLQQERSVVKSLAFNARGDHFVVGTSSGFKIYSVEPLALVSSTEVEGGVNTVQLLNQGQTLSVVLVGSGLSEDYPTHKVVFWEANSATSSSEINFVPEVINIKSIAGIMVVGLANQVRGFMLRDLAKFFQIKTCDNPKGHFSIASHEGVLTVASPSIQVGTVQVTRYREGRPIKGDKPVVIAAHQGIIACIALTRDGNTLATTSDQGTLIRLFSAHTGNKVQELRRGSESAVIKHIQFDWERGAYLTCCSDKATIHVFKTPPMVGSEAYSEQNEEQKAGENGAAANSTAQSGNTKSYLSALSSLVPYAGSEWSFAQMRLEQTTQIDEHSEVAAFVQGQKAFAITSQGFFASAQLESGGNVAVSTQNYFQLQQEL